MYPVFNIGLDTKGIIRGSIIGFPDSEIRASIIRSLLVLIEEAVLIEGFFQHSS